MSRDKARSRAVRRWFNPASLSPEWDARTIAIAGLIADGKSVLEFGAGRLVLARHLPPACTYTPSDVVDRGPGTLVCDLNRRPLPQFPRHDLVVFSGVLEYLSDLPGIVAHLPTFCDSAIASYVSARTASLFERLKRRGVGWVNHFTHEGFMALFASHGFRVVKQLPFGGTQRIYVFGLADTHESERRR